MMIKSTGEDAYFAASNSVSGFFSYYSEVFGGAHIERVYAVKGGPGTGKSRFLREVACAAELSGYRLEYIYCSSDPQSLDGVILTPPSGGSIALLDATAPHVFEPTLPGAREELINLGAFWDAERLRSQREEIELLGRKKGDAYRRAYRFLSGLGEMDRNRDELVFPYVKREKLSAYAERLMEGIPRGREYRVEPALLHSVGMYGAVGFDTYLAGAQKRYLIEDTRGTASFLLAELCKVARDKRLAIRLSHDPIEPQKLDGLFLRGSGVAFVVVPSDYASYSGKRIVMRRFVDTAAMKCIREELNHIERMRRGMLEGACDCLERVRVLHFRLEEIYSSAMDFHAKERFTKAFCNRLFQ